MGTLRKILASACAAAIAAAAAAAEPAARVVLVANADFPDSVAVAAHYARARGVPAANLIEIHAGTAETVAWRDFLSQVWQPVQDELVRRGWIDAIAMDLHDSVGRRKYAISGHTIEALVLCRGVPLRIADDPALAAEVRPLTDHPEFRTNQASVDSELSLLAQNDTPISACVPNPLFRERLPTQEEEQRVVKVSRLDGPTAADAMGLVDRAVEAERNGLLGRAYVDLAGPHESGNRWLRAAADRISELGFDLSVGRGPETFPVSARFDAPVLYLGWYAPDMNGPFTLPGFRFPPGAIAVHVHSFSAHTLRSTTEGWCGPLVSRGVTATVGNVYEPYLEYLHRPDLLLDALAGGQDLVDAAYYALPVLSWQSIVVGDPLYRPFLVPVSGQQRRIAELPPRLAGYAVMRRMNLLDAQGRTGDALAEGRLGMRDAPSLPLALAYGRRLAASGNREAAAWAVREAAQAEAPAPDTWEVLAESADFLATQGRPAEAIAVYRRLFEQDGLPRVALVDWLAQARRVALESGDTAQAAEWKEQLGRLLSGPAAGGH